MSDYIKKLLYILPSHKGEILLTMLLFVLSSGLEAIGIGVVGPFLALTNNFQIINQIPILEILFRLSGLGQETHFVALVGLFVIFVFLLKSFLAWATQVHIIKFSDHQQQRLIMKMTREYLAAPYIYHTKKNSASIVDNVIEIANTLSSAIFMPLLTTISNILVVAALLVLLFLTSTKIILLLMFILLPIFIFFNSFRKRIRHWGQQMRESRGSIIQIVNHAFGGVKETKVIGCESYFEQQIFDQARRLEDAHSNFAKFKILPRFVIESTMVVLIVALISTSLLFSSGIDNLTSVLGVFALAAIRLLPAVSNSINGINQLRGSIYTVDRTYFELRELEDLRKSQKARLSQSVIQFAKVQSPRKLTHLNGLSFSFDDVHLEFQDEIVLSEISYKYLNSSRYAISDLSMTIKKGESIAFIGKSGAGKTTLVDLILGLLLPQSGDLRVDGISVYQNLRAWQNLIGYIPQSIFLVDDTIEKNIAFGVPDDLIDKERLEMAIYSAQLSEVIDNLPQGLKTVVGERGVLLSGGQRQRVGIARSLYHSREILVLDEATAALDNKTEKLVIESIRSLSEKSKKTLITIAHRLTTVENCDRIYLIENGRIVKYGSYEEVVLASNYFSETSLRHFSDSQNL